jgi:hypothetical protein
MRKLRLLAAGVAVLAVLMMEVGAAQGTQSESHRRPPATTLTRVTVRAAGPSHRLVRVTSSGPPMSFVAVCDLTSSTCVNATRVSDAWVARLPAQHPEGPYAIGVVGRSPGGYVTGHSASDPPPALPPILDVG